MYPSENDIQISKADLPTTRIHNKLQANTQSIRLQSEESLDPTNVNLDALILDENEFICKFGNPCYRYKINWKEETRFKRFIFEYFGVYYEGNIRLNTLLSYTIDEYGLAYFIALSLISLAFIWNVYMIPLRWAFVQGTLIPNGNLTNSINRIPNSGFFYVIDLFADTLYVLDIVLIQSHKQYVSQGHGVKITSAKKTTLKYLCSWEFYLDLFSVFIPWIPELQYFATRQYHPLFRITRYLKFYRYNNFLLLIQRKLHYAQLFRQFRVLFQIILISHTLGCVFFLYYILQGQRKSGIFAGFLVVENENLHPLLFSFYWGFVMITNIHNQPRPNESSQYIFMVICHLIGSLHMAYVFAVFVSSLRVGNWHRNAFRIKAERARTVFSFFKDLKDVIRTRNAITNYYDYGYANHIELLENAILNYFPRKMRTNLAQECYFKTLKKVYLFKGLSESFFFRLLLGFENRIYLPKEDIYRLGDVGNELFIITKGQIKLIEGDKCVGDLKPGQIFGYHELFAQVPSERFRSIDARTESFTHLLVFHKRYIDTILHQLPKDDLVIRKTVRDMDRVFRIQRMRTFQLLGLGPLSESPRERGIRKFRSAIQVLQVLIYIFQHIPPALSSDESSSGDENVSSLQEIKRYFLPTIKCTNFHSDKKHSEIRPLILPKSNINDDLMINIKDIRSTSPLSKPKFRKPVESFILPANSLSYRRRDKTHFAINEKRLNS